MGLVGQVEASQSPTHLVIGPNIKAQNHLMGLKVRLWSTPTTPFAKNLQPIC